MSALLAQKLNIETSSLKKLNTGTLWGIFKNFEHALFAPPNLYVLP